jgi:hypothetical protein
MNGSMSTIVSGSIGDGPFNVVAKFVLTDLSVQAQGTTVVVAGETQLDWTSSSVTSETVVASGVSMTVRETVGTKTNTIAMKNLSQSVSVNGSVVTSSRLSCSGRTGPCRVGGHGRRAAPHVQRMVSHWRQAPALYRGGVLVGSVQQPRVKIDDVSLLLTRRF